MLRVCISYRRILQQAMLKNAFSRGSYLQDSGSSNKDGNPIYLYGKLNRRNHLSDKGMTGLHYKVSQGYRTKKKRQQNIKKQERKYFTDMEESINDKKKNQDENAQHYNTRKKENIQSENQKISNVDQDTESLKNELGVQAQIKKKQRNQDGQKSYLQVQEQQVQNNLMKQISKLQNFRIVYKLYDQQLVQFRQLSSLQKSDVIFDGFTEQNAPNLTIQFVVSMATATNFTNEFLTFMHFLLKIICLKCLNFQYDYTLFKKGVMGKFVNFSEKIMLYFPQMVTQIMVCYLVKFVHHVLRHDFLRVSGAQESEDELKWNLSGSKLEFLQAVEFILRYQYFSKQIVGWLEEELMKKENIQSSNLRQEIMVIRIMILYGSIPQKEREVSNYSQIIRKKVNNLMSKLLNESEKGYSKILIDNWMTIFTFLPLKIIQDKQYNVLQIMLKIIKNSLNESNGIYYFGLKDYEYIWQFIIKYYDYHFMDQMLSILRKYEEYLYLYTKYQYELNVNLFLVCKKYGYKSQFMSDKYLKVIKLHGSYERYIKLTQNQYFIKQFNLCIHLMYCCEITQRSEFQSHLLALSEKSLLQIFNIDAELIINFITKTKKCYAYQTQKFWRYHEKNYLKLFYKKINQQINKNHIEKNNIHNLINDDRFFYGIQGANILAMYIELYLFLSNQSRLQSTTAVAFYQQAKEILSHPAIIQFIEANINAPQLFWYYCLYLNNIDKRLDSKQAFAQKFSIQIADYLKRIPKTNNCLPYMPFTYFCPSIEREFLNYGQAQSFFHFSSENTRKNLNQTIIPLISNKNKVLKQKIQQLLLVGKKKSLLLDCFKDLKVDVADYPFVFDLLVESQKQSIVIIPNQSNQYIIGEYFRALEVYANTKNYFVFCIQKQNDPKVLFNNLRQTFSCL